MTYLMTKFIKIFVFIQGVMYPSMHGLPSKWVPPNERSKFVTAYVGK